MKTTKVIFLCFFFLCGIKAVAQIYTPVSPTTYGRKDNRAKADSAQHIPEKLGTFTNTSDTSAQIFYNKIDSSVYYFSKAKGFKKLSEGGGGGGGGAAYTITKNAKRDSIILSDGSNITIIKDSVGGLPLVYGLFMGQSNSAGAADNSIDTAFSPLVEGWDTTQRKYVTLKVGYSPMYITYAYGLYNNSISPSSQFFWARKYAREHNCRVRIINYAQGGRAIENWFNNGVPQIYLKDIIRISKDAGVPYFNFFGWDQGENNTGSTKADYTAKFDSIVANLNKEGLFNKTTKVAVIGMPRPYQGYADVFKNIDGILQSFDYNSNVNDGYADTDSATLNTNAVTDGGSRIHFNSQGLQYIGEKSMYAAFESLPRSYNTTNGALGMGGALNKTTTFDIGNNQLWLKTPFKSALDSTSTGGVFIGDDITIPSIAGSATNGINAALRINKDINNQLGYPSFLSMTTANAGYKNGWLFSNYSGAGGQYPTLATFSQSTDFSYVHSIFGRNNTLYGGMFINVANKDSSDLTLARPIVNTNLFSVSNNNFIKFKIRDNGDVYIGNNLATTLPSAKLHVVGTGLFTDTVTITTIGTFDSSNRAASTAWVKRQGYGGGGGGGALIDTTNQFINSIIAKNDSVITFIKGGNYINVAVKGVERVDTTSATGIASKDRLTNSLLQKWGLRGNSGTNSANDFIGTTDNQNLYFRVNNTLAGQLDNPKLNTSFGINALLSNTTGTENLAFGTSAMQQNTTGTKNMGFAPYSLFSNTIGTNNLAFGYNSLFSNVSGNFNIAIGRNSLYSNLSDNNIGIGFSALFTNVSGTNLTAIGYNSDVLTSGLTNATAIGANAKVGASNSLVLGDNANVGIGTASPVAKLDVVGDIKTNHIIGGSSTPTISVGAALGTGGTASVIGTDLGGNLTFNIGTSPPATTPGNGAVITFATAYTVAPRSIILTAGNDDTIDSFLNGGWFVNVSSISTTGFTVSSHSRGNQYPSTTLKFFYQVIQ